MRTEHSIRIGKAAPGYEGGDYEAAMLYLLRFARLARTKNTKRTIPIIIHMIHSSFDNLSIF